jgi:hypothetical protein
MTNGLQVKRIHSNMTFLTRISPIAYNKEGGKLKLGELQTRPRADRD